MTRPRVRRLLNATENLDLQSRQIEPIFDAIDELAEGTTRFTKQRTEDGVAGLYARLVAGDVSPFLGFQLTLVVVASAVAASVAWRNRASAPGRR